MEMRCNFSGSLELRCDFNGSLKMICPSKNRWKFDGTSMSPWKWYVTSMHHWNWRVIPVGNHNRSSLHNIWLSYDIHALTPFWVEWNDRTVSHKIFNSVWSHICVYVSLYFLSVYWRNQKHLLHYEISIDFEIPHIALTCGNHIYYYDMKYGSIAPTIISIIFSIGFGWSCTLLNEVIYSSDVDHIYFSRHNSSLVGGLSGAMDFDKIYFQH